MPDAIIQIAAATTRNTFNSLFEMREGRRAGRPRRSGAVPFQFSI